MDFLTTNERLMATNVAPWVERWEALSSKPLHVDMSEGYNGLGVFGARAGPYSSLDFSNVAHEMAHAIERLATNRPETLSQYGWGLAIRSQVEVDGRVYDIPRTAQASRREATVFGIQKRLLEMVGHPDAAYMRESMIKIVMDWMPDYFLGGSNAEECRADRFCHMDRAYQDWPPERVLSAWHHVVTYLPTVHPSPTPSPAMRPRR